MRGTRFATIFVLLAVLFAGLGQACSDTADGSTLTLGCVTREQADALESLVVKPYLAENPDARIRVVCLYEDSSEMPADIDATLPDKIAAGLKNDFDVFAGLSAEGLGKLVEQGIVAGLDTYLERTPEVVENMALPVESILRAEGDGKLYAVAPAFYGMALAYNADMFDAAGVKYPQGLLTWEEAFNLGQEVATKTPGRVAAFSFGPGRGEAGFCDTFLQHVPSAGVYVIDGDQVAVDGRFAELWDLFMDAEVRYALSKDGDAFWRGETALALIYNGQVDDPATFQSAPTYTRFRWDIAEPPVFDKARPVSYAGISNTFVMSSSSNLKEEAWGFLEYVSGPQLGESIAAMKNPGMPFGGSLPSCVTDEMFVAMKTRVDKNYESFYVYAAPRARAYPRNLGGANYVFTLLDRLMYETLNGRLDGAEVAAIINERGPGLLASTEVVDPMENPEALRDLIGF